MNEDTNFGSKKKKRIENTEWTIAFIIWGAGAFILWLVWEWQKSVPSPYGDFIAFVTYVACFFYFLAIGPIKDWVSRTLGQQQ